jgi:hypothetical protein
LVQKSANFRASPTNLSEIYELVSSVFSSVHEEKFQRDRRDFSREGPLNPELLTTLVLYMVADANRRGYTLLLDAFWDEARAHGLPLPTEDPVSAPSFCTARHKITSELLRHMLHMIAASPFWGERDVPRRWNGRRVFAIDGTKINLQRHPDLHERFGTPEGAYCPQVLLSVLLDVCAKLPMDLEISPFTGNERDQLSSMLDSLEQGDLLVLDRGYPSHEILQTLSLSKIDFLIRVPASNTFGIVDEFLESGSEDHLFRLNPPPGSPDHWHPLEVRLVRLKAPDGTESYFLTSLRRTEFGLSMLGELYHMRWEVEEFFKVLKGPYIGQGQFRSKSPAGVMQEIHALVLLLAITRLCMCAAADVTEQDCDSFSQKAAILGVAAHVTRLLLAPDEDFALRELGALLKRITRVRYRKRPGRSFPRRSFRPTPRWTASGRRGD